jgi:epoxyqueuosine reductase QueG
MEQTGPFMDVKVLIEEEIRLTIAEYSSRKTIQSTWRDPLVGYARASDPLFGRLKRVAHPDHLLPADLLKGATSVIAFFLPFTKSIVSSNTQGKLPSRQWACAYRETNELITLINSRLSSKIQSQGYHANTIPPTHNFDPVRLVSAWSHRHAAYIAGLGAFGLHRLLITEQGCCGRLGSLVTDLEVTPTPRPEGQSCLYHSSGSCTECIGHCISGALGIKDLDRQGCYRVLLDNERSLGLAGHADVCGKCSCGVPCSLENPVKSLKCLKI